MNLYQSNFFLALLGLMFIFLKLTNVIDWSWWMVLLPIYGGPLLAIGIFIYVGVFIVCFDKFLSAKK